MFILYSLIVISGILFFQGFFPVSPPNLDVDNNLPSEIQSISLDKHSLYTTNITKTIFIVIDALRLDFINPNYMPLTSRLLSDNGCFNKIKVETPTVTLPRIKALAAGNIPQFIDVVLNLASSEILSDSIIHSAVKKGKKIVFYGDDTWLKLFPKKFMRFEGTNSFFVRDFTEVDDNVTRNVNIELQNNDWDMMILHYLGLDHIGHVYGPFSSLIPFKLKEMDNIIYQSYQTSSLKNKNVLLMVTGDHGMRDSGGHGGSSYHETNVPLLIIGSKCENSSFPQTDIPVNLAVLLGLEIPSLAIGKVQKTVIHSKSSTDNYLYILYYNAFLLNQKHSCCKSLFDEANVYYVDYLKNLNQSSAHKAIHLYENCLEIISNSLAKGSIKQNLSYLIVASSVMLNSLIILFSQLVCSNENSSSRVLIYTMFVLVIVQFLVGENLLIFLVTFITLGLVLIKNIYILIQLLSSFKHSKTLHFFVFSSLLHPITFISSSYVEEEHQFWYFFNISFLFIHYLQLSKNKNITDMSLCIILLAIFRFLRTMNSTGDKWSNYPDLSDWLLQKENYVWYQILFILGLILAFLSQYYLTEFNKLLVNTINFIALTLIFVFKENESSILLGRLIWVIILTNFVLTYHDSKVIPWSLLLFLLLKPYNIILVPYCILSSLYFSKYLKKTELVVLYNSFLSNMLYFAQGHSNSLASVDISVGYIGLTSYQPVLVIIQVLCHTQAFPVLCHLLLFENKNIETALAWKILFCNRLYIFLVISVITYIFRHHLFIWSVFAPKLFIEFIHILFMYLEYLLYYFNQLYLSFKCKLYNLKLKKNHT